MSNYQRVITLILMMVCTPLLAVQMMPSGLQYYYQMGGGSDFSMPPVTAEQDLTIGGVSGGLGFSCGGFNPGVTINDTFQDMESSVMNVSQDVLQSATSAVGSFPFYILEKSSAELYTVEDRVPRL